MFCLFRYPARFLLARPTQCNTRTATAIVRGGEETRSSDRNSGYSDDANKNMAVIKVYVDLKSPMAYLALEPTLQIPRDYYCEIDWYPYDLPIAEYRGSAALGPNGEVISQVMGLLTCERKHRTNT